VKVRRREATDVLTRDGETVVLVDGVLVRLSELSALVYDLTEEPVDVVHLAQRLESRFGAPEGGTSLDATKDAVAHLVRHGILRES
jgi:hypothetical protein